MKESNCKSQTTLIQDSNQERKRASEHTVGGVDGDGKTGGGAPSHEINTVQLEKLVAADHHDTRSTLVLKIVAKGHQKARDRRPLPRCVVANLH
ncbi:hypothetical protein BDA96_08G187100 [Sorghum bicolor]|uniref:Uncharacterized protein n=2 Tax=Sorghum bicolor TaxID=4558 RepID=A0A921U809_SORBI|nr:hypothetical protein BDA96_08G187100 [Sorghum bicolor]OQU79601.1 hypothetical protein SORBI_3008G168932 [Sorghum bicolor]